MYTYGSRNVCSVSKIVLKGGVTINTSPGSEAKSLSFPRKASIQTNRRSHEHIDNDRPSACFGDNGGGLIVPMNRSNDKTGSTVEAKAIIIGINIGTACVSSLHSLPIPSVFTRVRNYNDWIKNKMEGGPSC